MNQIEANKKADALSAIMEGDGWEKKVWENIGWHYSVNNKNLYVYPLHYPDDTVSYSCLLGCTHPGTGETFWSNKFHSTDPNEAVQNQLLEAREFVKTCADVIRAVEDSLGKSKGKGELESFYYNRTTGNGDVSSYNIYRRDFTKITKSRFQWKMGKITNGQKANARF